jgi:hypothetical protein
MPYSKLFATNRERPASNNYANEEQQSVCMMDDVEEEGL